MKGTVIAAGVKSGSVRKIDIVTSVTHAHLRYSLNHQVESHLKVMFISGWKNLCSLYEMQTMCKTNMESLYEMQ